MMQCNRLIHIILVHLQAAAVTFAPKLPRLHIDDTILGVGNRVEKMNTEACALI